MRGSKVKEEENWMEEKKRGEIKGQEIKKKTKPREKHFLPSGPKPLFSPTPSRHPSPVTHDHNFIHKLSYCAFCKQGFSLLLFSLNNATCAPARVFLVPQTRCSGTFITACSEEVHYSFLSWENVPPFFPTAQTF